MPYDDSKKRVRLNKTDAECLVWALDHALHCWVESCSDCKDARLVLRGIRQKVKHQSKGAGRG